MNTKPKSYLNQMLSQLPKGAVATSTWLKSLGISNDLQQSYKRNGWLKSIGYGAFLRADEEPRLEGAIYTLQKQLNIKIHKGAISALEIYKLTHSLRALHRTIPEYAEIQFFIDEKTKLPKWFISTFAPEEYSKIFKTSFLPSNIGLVTVEWNNFYNLMSSPERAILEAIYLSPYEVSLKEAYQSLEMMVNATPSLLQQLLENCTSIKVKRLFLYMAEKIGHDWFQYLDLSKINLGSGKRVITKGGKLDKKYNIVIEDLDNI